MTPDFFAEIVQNHVMYLAFLHQRGANGEYRRDSIKDSLEIWLGCRDSSYELYELTKIQKGSIGLTISEKLVWKLVSETLKAEITTLDGLFEKELKQLNDAKDKEKL